MDFLKFDFLRKFQKKSDCCSSLVLLLHPGPTCRGNRAICPAANTTSAPPCPQATVNRGSGEVLVRLLRIEAMSHCDDGCRSRAARRNIVQRWQTLARLRLCGTLLTGLSTGRN
jgi:hypothetical protein